MKRRTGARCPPSSTGRAPQATPRSQHAASAACCERFAACSPVGAWRSLAGPTGEADLYAVRPRERVLCLAASDTDRLVQLAALSSVGSRALWPRDAAALRERLPAMLQERIELVDDWVLDDVDFDAVLHHGEPMERVQVVRAVAARAGPIVGITTLAPGDRDVPLERLVVERSLSINTAAAGGNATLMTME